MPIISSELAERWRQVPMRLSCLALGAVGGLEMLRLAHPEVTLLAAHRTLALSAVGLAIAAALLGTALRHARRS
jgi:hypothetical protein